MIEFAQDQAPPELVALHGRSAGILPHRTTAPCLSCMRLTLSSVAPEDGAVLRDRLGGETRCAVTAADGYQRLNEAAKPEERLNLVRHSIMGNLVEPDRSVSR